jgi:hypothetical protein
MKKINIDGLESATHVVKKGFDPQYLVMQNSSPDATLKIEVTKEKGSDEKLFNTIPLGFLLELQNKIEFSRGAGVMRQFELDIVKDSADADVTVLKESKIDLAYNGEIYLGQNDTVEIVANSLLKIASSSLYTFEGVGVSPNVYAIKELTFKLDEPQKKIDLESTDFLVLDAAKIPSEIEFRVGTQKVVRTPEAILIDQKDKFNTVGYNADGTPIFGTFKAVVIDVRACSEVIMEDDRAERIDIKYFTVKTPS